jgi:hypothetical protein
MESRKFTRGFKLEIGFQFLSLRQRITCTSSRSAPARLAKRIP